MHFNENFCISLIPKFLFKSTIYHIFEDKRLIIELKLIISQKYSYFLLSHKNFTFRDNKNYPKLLLKHKKLNKKIFCEKININL